jgi:hypothetical protein
MKKFFASAFVALSMLVLVSCGNPAINAAEDFIEKPTIENYNKVNKAIEDLDADEQQEFLQWSLEHWAEIAAAELACGIE